MLQQYFCRVKILDKKPCGKEKIMGYAHELFSYIKIAIDNGAAPGSYWLTGSQSYKLMSLAKESPAGRIAILNLTSLFPYGAFEFVVIRLVFI